MRMGSTLPGHQGSQSEAINSTLKVLFCHFESLNIIHNRIQSRRLVIFAGCILIGPRIVATGAQTKCIPAHYLMCREGAPATFL